MSKRIISTFLILTMIMPFANTTSAANPEYQTGNSNINTPTQLSNLIENSNDTLSGVHLVSHTDNEKVYSFMQKLVAVPSEAVLTDAYKSPISGVTIIDYNIGENRTIQEHLTDGTIRTTTKYDTYILVEHNGVFTTVPIPEETRYKMSDATKSKIRNAIANNKDITQIDGIEAETVGDATILREQISDIHAVPARASRTAALISVEKFFPPYNAKKVASTTRYIGAVDGIRTINAYETMDYYAETSFVSTAFNAGTTISIIATALGWKFKAVEIVLTSIGLLATGSTIINAAIDFYTEAEMEFWFAVESGIYDSTREMTEVQVTCDEAWSIFTYGLDSNRDPIWIMKGNGPRPMSHQDDNYQSFMRAAAESYNTHVKGNGSWIGGKGEFGK